MNKISQQLLLSAVFRKVLNREFQSNSLDDRIILQKIVFFMHEMGISCGNYKFVWDLYGPFSPALSDDMKKKVIDEQPVIFNQDAEDVMRNLNQVFSESSAYEPRYWIEAIASLLYLKEYIYPSYSNEELIAELETRKTTLQNHQENLKAMNALEKIMAM